MSSIQTGLCLLLLACGDKQQAEPITPSGPAPPADAVVVLVDDPPSRISLRAGGKPPVKTTQPLGRAPLDKLSRLELAGLTSRVRQLDDGFLDVEYTLALPIVVGVVVQPCLRCLPMQLDRWRAETDALRITLPPDLRERGDAVFEVATLALGGTPVIATYQQIADPVEQATCVYWNDGQNQIRVIARSTGKAGEVDRRELEQLALAVLDRFAQAW